MMESMRNLHIVLFIGVMCVVQTMSQVCPYSDARCTCSSNSLLTCNNLQQIPPLNTGANVIKVTDLSFYNANIASITKNSLPPGLTSLTLQSHALTNISEDAFDTSAATLQSIVFHNVNFKSLPPVLKTLTKLISLAIFDSVIQDWDTATLKQIGTTLENLQLINVGLSTYPSWIVDFHLLQEIELRSDSIYSIPDDAFSSIKDSLRFLYLSSIGLTHVPQALSTVSSLLDLFLNDNYFTDVSEIEKITGFPFAHKLSRLSLDSVGMSRIANFSNLTSLKDINLSSNRISDIPDGFLPASLTYLNLDNNSLPSVPKVIATLSTLSALYISNNLLTDIELTLFPKSLTYLDLGRNNITIITNTTFRNLNLLQNLDLSYNPISTISPEAFSDLVSLQTLNLRYSQLIEIPLVFARLNSHVEVSISATQPLACPCPVFHELVQWFTSLTNTFNIGATCSDGQSIYSYLSGQCDLSLATL